MDENRKSDLIRDDEVTVDFIVFETERLYAREFNIDDVDANFAYSGDAENTVFMDWGPESREGIEKFIHSCLKSQITDPRLNYDFAVCLKETGELIGAVGLYLTENRLQGELGYIFNKRFWGRGFASEAANGMLRFGFLGLDLHRIYAKCDSENTASESVMKRIGMRKEAEFKSSCYTRVRGRLQWRSEKHYAMLQREYLNALADAGY